MNDDLRIVLDGGPRNGETDVVGDRVVVIGTGTEGGVYQRTGEVSGRRTVYRWQELMETVEVRKIVAEWRRLTTSRSWAAEAMDARGFGPVSSSETR